MMKTLPENKKCTTRVTIGNNSPDKLNTLLSNSAYRDSKLFILVDSNTINHCLPLFETIVRRAQKAELIEIPAGEESKDLEICKGIWLSLSQLGADRNSVLINLGGGVVSDIGAFAASTYMRGIRCIHVPTSLLAMVDASIGGKTGIDLNGLKNMIGSFYMPEEVFIYPAFLDTLPEKHLRSGYAEIMKHALIADEDYWESLKRKPFSKVANWTPYIRKSVEIKESVIALDPFESGLRKVLNFGHTIGHAIESCSMQKNGKAMMHGEAVAIGMICESYLSYKLLGLPEELLDEITGFIISVFPWKPLPGRNDKLTELMRSDKKNMHDAICFTLLAGFGQVMIGQQCPESMILESLKYYEGLKN
jgi:3-dehydroquinate synthase